MGDFDEATKHFPSYFSAYRQFMSHDGPHYDATGNFIYLPTKAATVSVVYDYLHELNHAQLGNGILGMTVQTLTEILAVMEKHLFDFIRELLKKFALSAPLLYRKLFLFGTLDDQLHRERQVITTFWAQVHAHWKQLLSDPEFSQRLTLFERVLKRREVLLNNWRPVQEGIAVLATFASINSQDSSEQIDLALLSLQRAAKHEAVERKAIQDKLVALARREEARWEKGLGCETIYLQGYKQCVCIQQRAGSVTAAWIAAMVASHFPYQCCDLLDMAESAFDFWSNKGDLNFYSRLCRVSENPSLLKIATKEAHDTGALAESTRYRLLESATGEVNKQELSNESHLFGTWEQDFLLKSATLRTFLGESAKLLDKPIGFELLDAFKDDWRYDFRIAGHWLPPIISESGAITVNKEADSERTKRMFINSYEVERTRRLIRWMHTSPLH